ncbi:uncharacterized protein LOC143275937 [Babylonia areolata]|uniref:uncharacterized protein LOC143275937 n=1 Tax=Babylonia areolata TaxID=304850 RepID=UPI003FD45219
MELQNLVKVKVLTLDPAAEPVEVTVAAREGKVSAEQVFNKACDKLGLKSSSRTHFALFNKRDEPTLKYRLKEGIPVNNSEVYLGKWCFVSSQERDMVHVDPVAAHLVFLQAQHDVRSGKFDLTDDEKQKLEECLEPGFVAEDQFVLLCQRQANYHSLCVPHCRLLSALSTPDGALENDSVVTVVVSKFGAKLVAAETTATFTWFEVSSWTLSKEETTLTLAWQPDEKGEPSAVPLASPRVKFLLAGVLEMITILQRADDSGASFHTEMITVRDDGCTVWENGLYNPSQAKSVKYSM